MDYRSVRFLFCWVCAASLALGIPLFAFSQDRTPAVFSVPFVGCASDGQAGSLEPPEHREIGLAVGRSQAQQLAYYQSAALHIGVFAPRGWHCFGVYGSGGASLLVVPQPIDTAHILSAAWDGFTGPVIEVALADGESSGRYVVAEVIGRVFPAYREYARRVMESLDQGLPSGPYPADILSYKSKTLVEYETPAERDGLGTRSPLRRSGLPTKGAALLFGQAPSLLQLSVRLPNGSEELSSAIVAQFEREASSLSATAQRWQVIAEDAKPFVQVQR